MSKSSRKQTQREALARAREKQRHEIWNPNLPKSELRHFRETCQRFFDAYEAVARPASIARNPQHDQPTPQSHTGGPFLFGLNEEWPTTSAGPLAAVVEVHLSEVPVLPDPLKGSQLLQVFLELESNVAEPRYADGEWVVRVHNQIELRTPASNGPEIDRLPVAWTRIEHDVPNYPDDLECISEELRNAFERLPNWSALFVDRFPSGLATRIAGWPHWVANGGDIGTFCFQLHGDIIPVDFGFDGSLYFGFNESTGVWNCLWEIG